MKTKPALRLTAPIFAVLFQPSLGAQSTSREVSGAIVWTSAVPDGLFESRSHFTLVDGDGLIVPVPNRRSLAAIDAKGEVDALLFVAATHRAGTLAPTSVSRAPAGALWVRGGVGELYTLWRLEKSDTTRLSMLTALEMPPRLAVLSNAHFDADGNMYDRGVIVDSQGVARSFKWKTDVRGRSLGKTEIPRSLIKAAPSIIVTEANSRGPNSRTLFQPFGARALITDGPGGISAISSADGSKLRWYSWQGRLIATVERRFVNRSLSAEERNEAAKELTRIAKAYGKPVDQLPFGIPDVVPPIAAMDFDTQGRLWVTRTKGRGLPSESEVYGPNGSLLFVARWPSLSDIHFTGVARDNDAWAYVKSMNGNTQIARVRF
jgi:hypothetical protein